MSGVNSCEQEDTGGVAWAVTAKCTRDDTECVHVKAELLVCGEEESWRSNRERLSFIME